MRPFETFARSILLTALSSTFFVTAACTTEVKQGAPASRASHPNAPALPGDPSTPGNEPDCALTASCPDDATPEHPVPTIVPGEISTCGLKEDGTVFCWGYNDKGQLGVGTKSSRERPKKVLGLSDVVEVSVGYNFACARLASKEIDCWGNNDFGALGDGTKTDRSTPKPIAVNVPDAVEIRAFTWNACARTKSGEVYCWGRNDWGQLGNGTFEHSTVPVRVEGISDAVRIAGGQTNTCVLHATGAVSCWGGNRNHLFGGDSSVDVNRPTRLATFDDAVDVTVGYSSVCVLRANHTVQCMGSNRAGQLGAVTSGQDSSVPVIVTGRTDVRSVVSAAYFVCALDSRGVASCWGDNTDGGLGAKISNDMSYVPWDVVADWPFTRLMAGGGSTMCALETGGRFVCWGSNAFGQIDGTTGHTENAPVPAPTF